MVDIDTLFQAQFLVSLIFNALLLLLNGYTYRVNNTGSKFTFVSKIISVFIICDATNIPL